MVAGSGFTVNGSVGDESKPLHHYVNKVQSLMSMDEREAMLQHALRVPELFAVAQERFHPEMFDPPAEGPIVVAFFSAREAVNRYCKDGCLPADPKYAWSMVETEARAQIEAHPKQAPPGAWDLLCGQTGLFSWIFADDAVIDPAWGKALLIRFLQERRVWEPFKKVVDVAKNRMAADLRTALTLLQQELDAIDDLSGGGQDDERYRGRFTSLKDFMSKEHKFAWLVEGVLVDRQPAVLGGPRKGLKTSVAVDLALSLAAGKPFLGKFAVPSPRRVGVISVEQGRPGVQDLVRRIAKAKGVGADLDNFFLDFVLPKLGRPSELLLLARAVTEKQLDVLIMDPLYLALWNDKGLVNSADLAAMGSLLLGAANLCLQAGCTPVFCHHAGKAAQLNRSKDCEPMEMDDLSGAGVAEAARQFLLLSRRRPYQDDGRHEMWLWVGGSAGHSHTYGVTIDEGVVGKDFDARKWDVTVATGKEALEAAEKEKAAQKEAKKQADLEALVEQVKKDLEGRPKGETLTGLHESCHYNKAALRRALDALVDRCLAARTMVQKSCGPGLRSHEGWRLIRQEERGMTKEQWERVLKGEIIEVVLGLPAPAQPGSG
jgi:RecA-family ATPase